ncbi:hypothetical protein LXA43DRAFT_906542 [Ganoderma leucocontextum]|nr:hypothetical protein LXA43DRAFT_906542 [Ganoderma leucocontextum]
MTVPSPNASSSSSPSGSTASSSSAPSTASSSTAYSARTSTSNTSTSSEEVTLEDIERMALIEESRRKITELEKDKPLWEEKRKKREAEETKMDGEAARKAQAVKQKAAAEAEQDRQRQAAADALARKMRIEYLQAQATEERSSLRRRYSGRFWEISDAIQHFSSAGSTFDRTKYTAENPLVFEKVPWPTLLPPWRLRECDVTWEQVEKFFNTAYSQMRVKAYKEFVDKAHKRFHPDRWRARQLLKSIGEREWTDGVEAVTNTVVQAVTPIWRRSKTL